MADDAATASESTTTDSGPSTESEVKPTASAADAASTSSEAPRKEDGQTEKPLGEAGEKALQAWKDRAKEAEKREKDANARLKEIEDAEKSDQEKLTDERDALKGESTDAKAEALRLRVAIDKQLPPELVDRLRGSTKEELEADADELMGLKDRWSAKPEGEEKPKPTSLDGGARKPASKEVQPGLGRLAAAYAEGEKK